MAEQGKALSWQEVQEQRLAAEREQERQDRLERERERRAAQRALEAHGFDPKGYRVRLTMGDFGSMKDHRCQVTRVILERHPITRQERKYDSAYCYGETFAAAVAEAVRRRDLGLREAAEAAQRREEQAAEEALRQRQLRLELRAAAAPEALEALAKIVELHGYLTAGALRAAAAGDGS